MNIVLKQSLLSAGLFLSPLLGLDLLVWKRRLRSARFGGCWLCPESPPELEEETLLSD